MPYIFIGRYEERRLTQFEDNLKINFIYNVQTKRRGVRAPRILHDLNFRKRICKLRERNEKDF
jgi:hypothetical protein